MLLAGFGRLHSPLNNRPIRDAWARRAIVVFWVCIGVMFLPAGGVPAGGHRRPQGRLTRKLVWTSHWMSTA